MPKRNVRRRRGETVLEAFEREIAELDRQAGDVAAQLAAWERSNAQAEASDAEARTVLTLVREEGAAC